MCFSHSFGEESFGKYLFFPLCFLRGVPSAGFGSAAFRGILRGILRLAGGKMCATLLFSLLGEEGLPLFNTHQKPVLGEGC